MVLQSNLARCQDCETSIVTVIGAAKRQKFCPNCNGTELLAYRNALECEEAAQSLAAAPSLDELAWERRQQRYFRGVLLILFAMLLTIALFAHFHPAPQYIFVPEVISK